LRYQISGRQIDIGEALQTHVQTELGAVFEKYAGRPTDANVVFSRDAHEFVCEATVHLSTGLTTAGQGPCDRDLRRLRPVRREDGKAAAPLQAPPEGPPPRPPGAG
jgi:ribosomal subunit interface protein